MTRRRIALGAAVIALAAAAPAGAAPIVTVDSPPVGCCTGDKRPAITGQGTTGVGVSPVTVQVFQGGVVDDSPELSLQAEVGTGGRYSVAPNVDLADGTWTARALQSDPTGIGTSEALTFIVDTVKPAPTITAPTAGAAFSTSTPTITGRAGTAPGDNPSVRLFFTGPAAEFAITVPVAPDGTFSLVTPPLLDGNYGVSAAQQDVAGNGASSVESGFTVDTKAPETTIEAGPVPAAAGTRNVQVTFGASELSTYRCALDDNRLAVCEPPVVVLRDLKPGRHVLTVTAVDPAGNVDPTPARSVFTIAPPKIAVAPGALVATGGETGLRVRCPARKGAGPCEGRVELRRGARSILQKVGTFRIRPGKAARVKLILNDRGVDLLFKNGRIRVEVRIVAADGRGNVGRRTLRRTLTLPG